MVRKKILSMSNKTTSLLLALPVELVYRILDHLDSLTILLSVHDVCTRLNAITETYYRWQVSFTFIFNHHLRRITKDRRLPSSIVEISISVIENYNA